MSYDEAIEWLRGNRSMMNALSSVDPDLWIVRTAKADAAMLQQAYWIVKAHNEFLSKGS